MKRIISAVMCIVLLMAGASVASAAGDNGIYQYEIDGVEYTVEFENKDIAPDTMEALAQDLVGLRDESVQTYGLGCILFGHDWVTEVTYVTQHKVRAASPRCNKLTYEITYCEDCDETKEQVLVSTTRIYCCAED